jgi:hypothetical protein
VDATSGSRVSADIVSGKTMDINKFKEKNIFFIPRITYSTYGGIPVKGITS